MYGNNAIAASLLGIQSAQNQFYQSSTAFINSFSPVLAANAGDTEALGNLLDQGEAILDGGNPFQGNALAAQTLMASADIGLFQAGDDQFGSFLGMLTAEYSLYANLDSLKTSFDTSQSLLDILA